MNQFVLIKNSVTSKHYIIINRFFQNKLVIRRNKIRLLDFSLKHGTHIVFVLKQCQSRLVFFAKKIIIDYIDPFNIIFLERKNFIKIRKLFNQILDNPENVFEIYAFCNFDLFFQKAKFQVPLKSIGRCDDISVKIRIKPDCSR